MATSTTVRQREMTVGGKRSNIRFELAATQALISSIIHYLKQREISYDERQSLIHSGKKLKDLETRLIQRSQKHGK